MANPTDIVIPKEKLPRITTYFGLIRNLANNNTSGNDFVLQRNLTILTNEQWEILRKLIQIELDAEKDEDHSKLYAHLLKMFRIIENTGRTDGELTNIEFQFDEMLSTIAGHQNDPNGIDPNFDLYFTNLLALTQDPTEIRAAVKYLLLREFPNLPEYEGYELSAKEKALFEEIKKMDLDMVKFVADYILLGEQAGGRRRRRLGKTKKVRKH